MVKFNRRPVVFIRIVGTHNTENEVFHCVHFEAPAMGDIVPQPAHTSPEPNSNHSTEGGGGVSDGDGGQTEDETELVRDPSTDSDDLPTTGQNQMMVVFPPGSQRDQLQGLNSPLSSPPVRRVHQDLSVPLGGAQGPLNPPLLPLHQGLGGIGGAAGGGGALHHAPGQVMARNQLQAKFDIVQVLKLANLCF